MALDPTRARQAGVRPRAENHEHVIVLGIDPGLANTGYGVVARRGGRLAALDGGVIETAAGLAPERRLAAIHAARRASCSTSTRRDAVALEELYFGQNARSAFAVGQARGVVMLAAGQRGIAVLGLHAPAGQGRGLRHGPRGKDQVGRMVQALLALPAPPTPDHAADALAVAICHANHAPLGAAMAAAG